MRCLDGVQMKKFYKDEVLKIAFLKKKLKMQITYFLTLDNDHMWSPNMMITHDAT